MCTSRAGCEGECESCRKDGLHLRERSYDDGKLIFLSGYPETRKETEEAKEKFNKFFEGMLIRAQLAGDIYRNNLKNLYNTKEGAFYE